MTFVVLISYSVFMLGSTQFTCFTSSLLVLSLHALLDDLSRSHFHIYIVSVCTGLLVKHVLSLHALLDDLSRAHFLRLELLHDVQKTRVHL